MVNPYDRWGGEPGYAGKILRVDLSSVRMTDVPTANYAN